MPSSPDYLKEQLATMAPHRALLRSVESRIMAAVPMLHPVLDVGCGDGHFAASTFTEPIDVGIDPMERDITECAALRPRTYKTLVLGSATRMPFADESFQTVISNSVLEHIPDVDATVGEISRVLKPGGEFVMTTPSEYYAEFLLGATVPRKVGLNDLGRAYGDLFNKISFHYHVDTPEVWTERFERAGLEVVAHTYYFSAAAHRAFDMAHYLGIPNLACKRLRGEWVIHPLQAKPLELWYRRYYNEPPQEQGAYQFFRVRKPAIASAAAGT
ncbi:MAG: methyltransferase domain-containing protein [Thermomicrobiales bacterium]